MYIPGTIHVCTCIYVGGSGFILTGVDPSICFASEISGELFVAKEVFNLQETLLLSGHHEIPMCPVGKPGSYSTN